MTALACSLDAASLQAWYGERLDLKSDSQLAKDIQRAEALITNMLRTPEGAKLKQELLALKLPSAVLRTVVRYGQIPAQPDARKGEFTTVVQVPGFKDKPVAVTLLVPET